jgi:hypothetical protein
VNPLTAWPIVKAVAPYLIGALILAALAWLVWDHQRLSHLDQAHQACLASVAGKPNSAPLANTCEPPIAAAATAARAAAACDSALTRGDTFAASQACTGPTKRVIADRDSEASEAANLSDQLARAGADQAAAVNRAAARATATAQGLTHAQTVLAAAPRGSDGLSVCDADCLRQLSPGPAPGPIGH